MRALLGSMLAISLGIVQPLPTAVAEIPSSPLWQKWVAKPGDEYASGIAVNPEGSAVFTIGTTYRPTNGDHVISFLFDASSGDTIWSTRFDGPSRGGAQASAVAVAANGATIVALAVSSEGEGLSDIATIAYDAADGRQTWVDLFDGRTHGLDYPGGLALSPDGSSAYVVGTLSNGKGHGSDLAVIAYDVVTGTRSWQAGYNGPVSGGWRRGSHG